MIETNTNNHTKVFNTPIELGLRALIILQAGNGGVMDLEKIMYLDHLCLNTSDINGPESLHAPTPNRGVQVFSKKALLQKGISIMLSKELMELIVTQEGFYYGISEAGEMFLKMFQTKYYLEFVKRSDWVLERWGKIPTSQIKNFIDTNLQNWGGEFLSTDDSNKS